jgi:hypothetical protein
MTLMLSKYHAVIVLLIWEITIIKTIKLTTRVINIKTLEPYDVYIGNFVRFHPEKYPQTKWGNPYSKYLKNMGERRLSKCTENTL